MVPPGDIWCYLRNRVSKNTPSRQLVNREVAAGLYFVPPGKEGGDETIDDVSEWRRHEGWDLAVCMTDLPLVCSDGRAVVAGASRRRDAALVSLPALGVIHRRRRALEEIVRLVSELRSDNIEPAREGEESRNGGANGHMVSSDDENLQLVMPAEVSKVRLLAGMVPSESSSASTMRSLRRWAQSPSR
jgi:hypothetical protein